jgi:hypothetical protein
MMIASLLKTIDEFFGTFYPGSGHELFFHFGQVFNIAEAA